MKESLRDIHGLLTGHANPSIVRQAIAKDVDAIVLLPDGETVSYKGKFDLLGSSGCAEGQS